MSDLFPATDLDEFLSIRPHVRSHEHVAWGRFALRVPVNRLTGFVTVLGPETVEVRKRVARGSLVNASVTLHIQGGRGMRYYRSACTPRGGDHREHLGVYLSLFFQI